MQKKWGVKCIFFQKYLVNSKKSSTFVVDFAREADIAPSGGGKIAIKRVEALLGGSRFSRLTGDRSGCYRLVA